MDTQNEIKYCSVCEVPLHLHATCCGWANAHYILEPKTELEAHWKRRKEEASGMRVLTGDSITIAISPQLKQADVSGWVDIEKQKPEYMHCCLITNKWGNVTEAQYTGEDNVFTIGEEEHRAIAWMEMPPPFR